MVPLLADASRPSGYDFAVERVDVVYQDIAQRSQASIFLRNMVTFRSPSGYLVLKSRSEDVSRSPASMFEEVRRELGRGNLRVQDMLPLDPLEKDHAMFAVGWR